MNKLYKIVVLLIICLLTTISIFIIYQKTYVDVYTFLSIGDGLSLGLNPSEIKSYGYNEYIKTYFKNKNIKYDYFNYSEKNISIKELTNELIYMNNTILEEYLRKSDIVVLSIGEYEINSNKTIANIEKDLDYLINEIKKYNNNICLLSKYYFNEDTTKIDELNKTYKELSKKHKLKYINIDYTSLYLTNNNTLYPNLKGYENISFSIIKAMEI